MKPGLLIKNVREALGLDRAQLAAALEIHIKTLAEFEFGHQPPRRTVLMSVECLLRRRGWADMADAFRKQTGGRP